MLIYPFANRICDTLLAKPADCGSRCRPYFPHQWVSPHRVSAATFSPFRASFCLRSQRFNPDNPLGANKQKRPFVGELVEP